MQDLELQRKRDIGLRAIREIEASYDGRNDDLSEEEIEALAVRAGREINDAVKERIRTERFTLADES